MGALDRSDDHHHVCAVLLRDATERRVIPAPVLVEVDYFCSLIGPSVFPALLSDIASGASEVEDLRPDDYTRVGELMERYSDLRAGFVDAAVLAIVERLGERKLATLDRRHFSAMRPVHIAALELVPH